MSIRLLPPTPPPPPDPVCVLLDAGHKLMDAVIDSKPDLRDGERFLLRLGVVFLDAALRPANCRPPS